MFVARTGFGHEKCARCGRMKPLTKDHFIPKSCRMTVNREGNYVGLCAECNHEKANQIVLPSWYTYLSEEQRSFLNHYMRYARGWIIENCSDPEILEYIASL